jgi:hypothetical protein
MLTRSHNETVTFNRPFLLKGVDRMLPAGSYRVVTDEELIEGLSVPVYRRVATMIFVPGDLRRSTSVEMVAIDPSELKAARKRDAEPQQAPMTDAAPASEGHLNDRSRG